MAVRSQLETQRIRYLLGLCSAGEREQIESQYFADEAAFAEMLTAEDDLIDAYARGELTGEERQRFEAHFLTKVRRTNRLRFARALTAVSGPRPSERRSHAALLDTFKSFREGPVALRLATIATVIVFVAVLSWILVERTRLRKELPKLPAENVNTGETHALETNMPPENPRGAVDKSVRREPGTKNIRRRSSGPIAKVRTDDEKISVSEARSRKSEAELGAIFSTQLQASLNPQIPLSAPIVPTVTLVPLRPRSAGSNSRTSIGVPSFQNSIMFHLSLETPPKHLEYRAAIQTSKGVHVISVSWTAAFEPSSTIDTPAISTAGFRSGNHVLFLSGKKPDGSFVLLAEYSFQLIKN